MAENKHVGPSTLWAKLPFNEMLSLVTQSHDRSFITPEAHCFIYHDEIEGKCARHRHHFYANKATTLTFIIDLTMNNRGKIVQSHFIYSNGGEEEEETKQTGRQFHHLDGEDKWDSYCKSLFRVLYKQFLL